jgi:hypothetical protein
MPNNEEDLTIEVKSYDIAKPGEHPAICANAVFLKDHDAGEYGIRDEIALTFYLTDQSTSTGKPVRAYRNITTATGPGANLPKFLAALGAPPLPPVGGKYALKVASLIGANCRLIMVSGTKRNGQAKSKIADILPPLPGTPKLLIPPEFALTGRTGSQSSSVFQPQSATPLDSKPVHSSTWPRYGSVEEMKETAGVEESTVTDLATVNARIAEGKAKARAMVKDRSFTTGAGQNTPVEEDADFPLQ